MRQIINKTAIVARIATLEHLLAVALLATALLPSTAGAARIDLRAAQVEDLDGASTLRISAAGATLELATDTGVLNRTASGFGINAPGGDDADAIDGGSLVEVVHLRFDVAVDAVALELSGFGRLDAAELLVQGSVLHVDSAASDVLRGLQLAPGAALSLRYLAGNGFSLDAVEFQPGVTPPQAVDPLPAGPGPVLPGTPAPAAAAVTLPAPPSSLLALPLAALALLARPHRAGQRRRPG